jgi:hypothetical protein
MGSGRRTATAITAVAAATLAALLAWAPAAHAGGIGIYGLAGAGGADWQDGWNEDDHWDNSDNWRDTTHTGAGLVFDAGYPGAFLGYRMSVGWERVEQDGAAGVPGLTLEGVVVDQDLTMTLVRGPLRLWVGPELRLAYLNGEWGGGAHEDFFAAGLGPVIGFDIALGPAAALSWKLGYLVTSYAPTSNSFDEHDDASIGEGHAYASLAILFNTWGSRPASPPPAAYPPAGYPPPGYPPPPPSYQQR